MSYTIQFTHETLPTTSQARRAVGLAALGPNVVSGSTGTGLSGVLTGDGESVGVAVLDGLTYDANTRTLTASGGGGGGAPTDAKYLTLSTNATLTQERVLTAGTGIGLTDGGAGSTLTVAVNDAELLALAGLTSAADRVPYFTGSGTASLATLTAAGRALLDDADASAQRTTLGLGTAATAASGDFDAAGTAASAVAALSSVYQPLDSDLTAIAALTTTSYGRAFLALADAAAGRTALGLGTLATQSGTFSGTSSGNNTGDQTSVTGNAGTATALQTARAINGVAFDGSAAITITAAPSGSAGGALGGTYPNPTQVIAGSVFYAVPANGTLVLSAKAAFAFTLNEIRGLKTSAGTLTLSVKINGTDVTGLASLSVTSSTQDATATAANAVAVGDRITVVIASTSSAADLEFTMKATR